MANPNEKTDVENLAERYRDFVSRKWTPTIVDAFVQFRADASNSEATSLTIEGQATDEAGGAPPFVSSDRNVTSRARTGACSRPGP